MAFFIAMFLCDLSIPLATLLGGYFMYKRTPKNVNDFLGYRTTRSKRNPETWSFANKYCGKLWVIIGWILLPTVAVLLPFRNSGEDAIGTVVLILIVVQIIAMLIPVFLTEKKLKERFPDEN